MNLQHLRHPLDEYETTRVRATDPKGTSWELWAGRLWANPTFDELVGTYYTQSAAEASRHQFLRLVVAAQKMAGTWTPF